MDLAFGSASALSKASLRKKCSQLLNFVTSGFYLWVQFHFGFYLFSLHQLQWSDQTLSLINQMKKMLINQLKNVFNARDTQNSLLLAICFPLLGWYCGGIRPIYVVTHRSLIRVFRGSPCRNQSLEYCHWLRNVTVSQINQCMYYVVFGNLQVWLRLHWAAKRHSEITPGDQST